MIHSGMQMLRKKCSINLIFVSLGKDWEFAVHRIIASLIPQGNSRCLSIVSRTQQDPVMIKEHHKKHEQILPPRIKEGFLPVEACG